jgi:uncharacterized protein YbjQ (UPF0145 family)
MRTRIALRGLFALIVAAVTVTGCTYTVAHLDYARHPELQSVRLWTDRQDARVANLGDVDANEGGWTDCDAMATAAALRLLDDARAMGADAVVATRFQNNSHWAGRPRCRRNWVLLGHMTVRATGIAVKDVPTSRTASASTRRER